VIARLDALTEELSFSSVSAEHEGRRKVCMCELWPATPQLKFANGRVIERVFRKALCVSNRSQFRQAALGSVTLPNCNCPI